MLSTTLGRKLAQQLTAPLPFSEKTEASARDPSVSSTSFLLPPSGLMRKGISLDKPDLLPHVLDPTADNFLHFYSLSLYSLFSFACLLVPFPKYI